MKKRFPMSAVCAAAMSLCAVAPVNAQGCGGAAAIPQLPFHLVENFFHYPANLIVGRVSGIAIGPAGNTVAEHLSKTRLVACVWMCAANY